MSYLLVGTCIMIKMDIIKDYKISEKKISLVHNIAKISFILRWNQTPQPDKKKVFLTGSHAHQ